MLDVHDESTCLNIRSSICKANIYPSNSTRFSLSVAENEQADAGQGDRARLARLNFQARRRMGKNSCSPFQLTTSRFGNHTRLSYTLLKLLTIQTYIHMYMPRMHLQGHHCMFTVSVLYQHTSSLPTVQHAH